MTKEDIEIQSLRRQVAQLEGEAAALQRFVDSIIKSEGYYSKHNISCPCLNDAIDEAINAMDEYEKENSNW